MRSIAVNEEGMGTRAISTPMPRRNLTVCCRSNRRHQSPLPLLPKNERATECVPVALFVGQPRARLPVASSVVLHRGCSGQARQRQENQSQRQQQRRRYHTREV